MSYTNQLINETSPYLLQHAHNPVDWLPYKTEAFERAKLENKPILISIGYSACHWCHVMEHETFEDESIAKIMNDNFICIKVDREEHPDVDHVYMDAVQQIHGNGGWPLNCFALPDGKPFWGGTYFKPEQWKLLLTNITHLFRNKYADLEAQASEIVEGVARQNYLLNVEIAETIGSLDFYAIYKKLHNAFDTEKGGIRGAPKFPMPVVLDFLLHYSKTEKDPEALKIVELTLQKMAQGGIYDQVGGGFARYSTDSDWKVPHFEKMLYDNAQLIGLYSIAFRETGNLLYKSVIEQTIEFLNREMKSPEGSYFSALDADSEGEEGLFYTWTTAEFNEILGHYAALAGEYYGVGALGLWENDRNILLRPESDELFAQQHFLSTEELASLTGFCKQQLLKTRSLRVRPSLDDKMLVSWNSLLSSALIDASIALDRKDYFQSALQTANFIVHNLKRPAGGLFHTWKNGKAQIEAFLDDYAFTCEAFLKLYSVTTDITWLDETEKLVSFVTEHFHDSHSGFFWYSQHTDKQVFTRKIEIYDGVIPSANSAMATVLNNLGIFLHNDDFIEKSKGMILAIESKIQQQPTAYSNWAKLALTCRKEQKVIAVVGQDAVSVIRQLKKEKINTELIFGSTIKSNLPYFKNRFIEGKTLIYVCVGSHCLMPVETVEEAVELLRF
ncbi:MAG: thioredoxin domain-containing protein [Bacteroidales bacterium]